MTSWWQLGLLAHYMCREEKPGTCRGICKAKPKLRVGGWMGAILTNLITGN